MVFKSIKASIAALAVLAVPFAAQAADVPIKAPRYGGDASGDAPVRAPYYKGAPRSVVSYYNWTGFYLGVNAGYAMGTATWQSPPVAPKIKGSMFGGTAGYNWQSGAIVYGFEGDLDWSTVKGSAACAAATCENKNIWFATVRGRLGYAMDRWLPYVTAGTAFGNFKATNFNFAPPNRDGATATPFGWTAGVGLEYAFMGNWSAKMEYLYADLGKFSCLHCDGGTPNNVAVKENIVRAGLNYKFSGPTRF
jgi:outer membrane immunogenic protein